MGYLLGVQNLIYILAFSLLFCIDGLVQDCSNSSASALELLQSCAKSSIWNIAQYGSMLWWASNRLSTLLNFTSIDWCSHDKGCRPSVYIWNIDYLCYFAVVFHALYWKACVIIEHFLCQEYFYSSYPPYMLAISCVKITWYTCICCLSWFSIN